MSVKDPDLTIRDVPIYQQFLSRDAQEEMLAEVREVVRVAPLVQPITPSGKKMSVRMTSAGALGWVTDRAGYRYQAHHPDGEDWPPIPDSVLNVWREVSGTDRLPECCLVNLYRDAAKMGLHHDRDEADLTAPVVSISLGDDALFRIGNTTRGGKTESVWLKSGDVLVLRGKSRLLYHGIDRTRPGSSTLLEGGGRLNLTLRIVT
ncbi:MAG: alpha-ketoglutarate-dependent dioxygenase AlkB [Pseudomonadota bacterium]